MKRRLPALVLALILCLSLASPALAAAPDENGFIISNGILLEYRGPGGDVVIPSGVHTVGSGAFDERTAVRSVVIPSGVTYIGIRAFRNCTALSRVEFPDTLTEIDAEAFLGCISLTEVTLPDSVTLLGERGSIFYGCTNLKRVTLGKGLAKLPHHTFGNCANLISISVPSNVQAFTWPFAGCPNVVIHGAAGSRAQAYAEEVGLPFSSDLTGGAVVARFTDVPSTSPYAAGILWAVEYGITTGKTATTFAPNETCTLGQLLTFLWRASGSPKSNEANHFTDPIPKPYQMAAKWAYEMGLVTGPVLGADTPCTRQTVIICLWKMAKSPAAFSVPFTDIPKGSQAHMAASWAVTTHVADNGANYRFSPEAPCSRGEALTYLYRATKRGIPAPPLPGERDLVIVDSIIL